MMKKTLLISLTLLMNLSFGLLAQEYCLTAPFGHGKNATGGAGGSVVTVDTYDELKNAIKADGKAIILIDGTVEFSGKMSEQVNDKTIIGLPGSALYNPNRTTSGSGLLNFKSGSENVIMRNVTFKSAGAYDCDGRDNLCIDGGTNIWVDHCDFQDGVDGNFDCKNDADNITITWCRFRYLISPKSGGETDDHRFSNLLGSSSSDKPSDGTYNLTIAYNWWDHGCVERMLRCRNAELDFISNYWNSDDAKYYIGPQNVDFYAEGCNFGSTPTSGVVKDAYGGTNNWTFKNCSGNPSNQGSVSAPSYSYTAYSASDSKTYITSSCGAGATLQVDASTGAVSSSCDNGNPGTTYTLTANSSGSGSVSGAGTYNEGSTASLTATAASGWKFSNWSGDASGTSNPLSVSMSGNKTITAVFEEDENGGGGTITTGNMVHNYTTSGTSSTFYTISGNLSDSKGDVSYNGLTLTQCLKIESSTDISFTTANPGTLTLVLNEGWSGRIKIDDTAYDVTDGLYITTLDAGAHTITKGDSGNLYFMSMTDNSTNIKTVASNIRIYPNPVSNNLYVVAESNIKSLDVYTISGSLVRHTNDSSIEMGDLPNGTYIVIVRTSNDIITKKVIKR